MLRRGNISLGLLVVYCLMTLLPAISSIACPCVTHRAFRVDLSVCGCGLSHNHHHHGGSVCDSDCTDHVVSPELCSCGFDHRAETSRSLCWQSTGECCHCDHDTTLTLYTFNDAEGDLRFLCRVAMSHLPALLTPCGEMAEAPSQSLEFSIERPPLIRDLFLASAWAFRAPPVLV